MTEEQKKEWQQRLAAELRAMADFAEAGKIDMCLIGTVGPGDTFMHQGRVPAANIWINNVEDALLALSLAEVMKGEVMDGFSGSKSMPHVEVVLPPGQKMN